MPSQLPPLDLSGAAWHGPPHPEVVNAATFALRRAVNVYPDDSALRAAIAASHDIAPSRVVIGHGAGELLRAALRAVAVGEVEIVWPGWGLLPSLVTEAGSTPVPVERAERDADRRALPAQRSDGRGSRPRAGRGRG